MTLLFIDGFEVTDAYKYTSSSGYTTGTGGRYGGRCGGGSSPNTMDISKSFTASSKIIFGVGIYVTSGGPSNNTNIYLYGDNGATNHTTLNIAGTGVMTITSGGASRGTYNLPQNVWNYIEFSNTIADSGGVLEMRNNGITTPVFSYTGDTKNGGTNTTIDKFAISQSASAGSPYIKFDDLYILNDSGSAPQNTFLGDIRIAAISPNNNGASSQFVGSDGNSTDNYLLVADGTSVNTANYVGSPTSGNRDSYAMSDVTSAAASIHGIQMNNVVQKSDAGAISIKGFLYDSSTRQYGTTMALTASWTGLTDIWQTNPFTSSAWTYTALNALEAGVEVV